jgi:hypothetical protein
LTLLVRRSADLNALGIDADDLAELADDHRRGGVVDEIDAGDCAILAVILVDVGALTRIPKMGIPQK